MRKRALSQTFAGKSAVTQAQTTLERVRREIPIANGDLRRQQDLKQEYSQQLESLLLLQEQIRAVTPSKTPEYWNAEVNKLQAELSAAQKALPELTTRKTHCMKKFANWNDNRARRSLRLMFLASWVEKSAWSRTNWLRLRSCGIRRITLVLSNLKRDLFCITFLYKPTSEGISPLFNELSKLFASVKLRWLLLIWMPS